MATPARLPAKSRQPSAGGGKSPAGAALKSAADPASWLASIAGNWMEFAVPIAVLGIVLAMIAPLPPFLLDVLISANITLSMVVLLVSLYVTKPVDFNVFPATLLLMTLFRLALNIS